MIIPYNTMDEEHFPGFKGGEGALEAKMFSDGLNRILYGRLVPGASIGRHTHESNSEIIYVLSGTGTVLYDDGQEPVSAGQCHYCPKGHAHSLINDSDADLTFFAVVPEQ